MTPQLPSLVATLPKPTRADIALATAFVDGDYRATVDPAWFARQRSAAIRQIAMLEMGKRQDREHKERFATKQKRRAA